MVGILGRLLPDSVCKLSVNWLIAALPHCEYATPAEGKLVVFDR